MIRHSVSAEEIRSWINANAYQLDSPGVVTLQEQTSVIRDWSKEPYASDLKFCLASPVEYSAVVSNLGMAILYQEINDNGKEPSSTGVLCERAYFPEKKLLTRLNKKSWPIFSKESFQPISNFDVFAISSYYPLQYFNVPRMLEMSGIPAWSKDRDGKNAPIIMGGGISFYNAEPVSDFFDVFFIGEGEHKLLEVLKICKECRLEDGSIDKEKYLFRLAKETDYMYVPSFYDVKYFTGFGVKERTSKIPEAKPIIRRALCNIYETEPLTRTFVPVCDSADMSIASVEISRGCSASCNFCLPADEKIVSTKGLVQFTDASDRNLPSISENSVVSKRSSNLIFNGEKEVFEFSVNHRTVRATEDHRVQLEDGSWTTLMDAFTSKKNLRRIPFTRPTKFSRDAATIVVLSSAYCYIENSGSLSITIPAERKVFDSLIKWFVPSADSISPDGMRRHIRYTSGHLFELAKTVFGEHCSEQSNLNYSLTSVDDAASFIFGLMATDMNVVYTGKGSLIHFESVSEKLNDFISAALWQCGIYHVCHKQPYRYVCTIGSKYEMWKLKEIFNAFKGELEFDFPDVEVSETPLRPLRITSAKLVGKMPVYDIEVEDTHNFIANGFILHNCEGSARTMPLRERPLDVSLKAFDDVHKETGCFDTTPYGFNLSDHSNIRTMLRYLAKNQDVKIQMSSQRIDMFTEDFAKLAYMTGNRSVTLAIEGGSQRLRDSVNKNLTTQQILEAFEIAMKVGFNKVKIYMIANLPFESCDDIDGTPNHLSADKKFGDVEYPDEDAIEVEFEDGEKVVVSKNFVFEKRLGETTADMLKPGMEVLYE